MSLILILFLGVKSYDDFKVKVNIESKNCYKPDSFENNKYDYDSHNSYHFTTCTNIKDITFTIDQSVPDYYFASSDVMSVKLKSPLSTIGEGAFAFCENLETINFPSSLTSIKNYAFYKSNIKTIQTEGLGNFDTGEAAFYYCSKLEVTQSLVRNIGTIGLSAFEGCSNMKGSLRFFGTISIEKRAFYGCSKLNGLTFSSSLTTIDDYAFYGCSDLNSYLSFPSALERIGNYSFSGCSKLKGSIIIPDSVNDIGNYAFSGCSGFTGSLELPQGLTFMGKNIFYDCNGLSGSFNIPTNVIEISDDLFSGNTKLTGSLVLPEGIKRIGKRAFLDCSEITGTLNLPPLLVNIDDEAFSGCTGLTGSLVIPETVTRIGNRAFYGCSGFSGELKFGKNIEEIGDFAFSECSNFSDTLKFTISRLDIGEYAFQNCTGFDGGDLRIKISSIYNVTSNERAFLTIDTKAFDKINFENIYYNGKHSPFCDVDIGLSESNEIKASEDFADNSFCGYRLYDFNPPKKKKGLSGGAIAGIVIACVVVVAGIVVGVIFLLKAKGKIGNSEASP